MTVFEPVQPELLTPLYSGTGYLPKLKQSTNFNSSLRTPTRSSNTVLNKI